MRREAPLARNFLLGCQNNAVSKSREREFARAILRRHSGAAVVVLFWQPTPSDFSPRRRNFASQNTFLCHSRGDAKLDLLCKLNSLKPPEHSQKGTFWAMRRGAKRVQPATVVAEDSRRGYGTACLP